MKTYIMIVASFFILFAASCGGVQQKEIIEKEIEPKKEVETGAQQMDQYLPLLKDKNVGMVVNQTSIIGNTHLVDSLLKRNILIKKIYAPEHGFRGKADAGEDIDDRVDAKTGLPIFSIYGKSKKPSKELLEDIDIMVFDIQDVGARFYTYISTLHYVMEACAENGIPVIVLDRPNPNGRYVDGPVLQKKYKSFIGMHPVPIVYGMTIGEYAQMINGESWMEKGIQCDLKVIHLENWTHDTPYTLPIKPSPNLPNNRSILLYPSLCLFEGTVVSIGRGTPNQFQVVGHPDFTKGDYEFTPQPNEGAKYPKLAGKKCKGYYFNESDDVYFTKKQIDMSIILKYYNNLNIENFFLKSGFFDKLAGNGILIGQIQQKMPEAEIRKSWANDLQKFKVIRSKYLIYD